MGIDADAKYSRFNYLNLDAYHASLVANQGELQREMKTCLGSGLGDSSVERMYLSLALEMVLEQQQKAQQEFAEESALITRFASPNSGMYQPQSPALVFEEKNESNAADETENILASKNSSNDDPDLKNESFVIQRYRGDSIGSNKSVDTTSTPFLNQHDCEDGAITGKAMSPFGKKRSSRKKPRKTNQGSVYLDASNSVHLYQAEDGQLVFLNGFNMTCLSSDFSKGPSSGSPSSNDTDGGNSQGECREKSNQIQAGPFPDFLQGRVLEKENVHLTSEIRKRMPFLNHIPLYTDIVFVELDLNHVLSAETRRKFKHEIMKRRKKRQSKVQAEKRVDLQLQKKEQDRINARKARLQTVDPEDEFFRALVAPPLEIAPEAADFGPVPGSESITLSSGIADEIVAVGQNLEISSPPSSSSFSFSQAAQRANAAEAFPVLVSSEAFPTLGAQPTSAPSRRGGSSTWRSEASSAKMGSSTVAGVNPGGKKKKKKGQKLVLFSTGGARGY